MNDFWEIDEKLLDKRCWTRELIYVHRTRIVVGAILGFILGLIVGLPI